MNKFDPGKDYYEVLGVSEDADRDEIDRVFRTRARERHPDHGGDEEEMKSLNEAHDVLSDPETRDAYDAERNPRLLYTPVPAFDPETASRGDTLEIRLDSGELGGLLVAAAACFGLGLPFLVLIEMQWIVLLWPLRLLTIGALCLGVFLARSAMRLWMISEREKSQRAVAPRWLLEVIFWLVAVSGGYLLYYSLYSR